MRPLKYFLLKAKYSLFKNLSQANAKVMEFKLTNGYAAFSVKYQNKWYVKYSPILSILLMIIVAPTISLGVAIFNKNFIHNDSLHTIIRVLTWLIMLLPILGTLWLHTKGFLLSIIKSYVDFQIKKKFNSNVNDYVNKMNDELIELEKFNIIKEKEQLEQLLQPISIAKEQTHKKKMKI
jgi:hypothetical protein